MFLTREERLRYLGFDDRIVLLVGIPLTAALATLLFVAGDEVRHAHLVLCLVISLAHTSVYWVVDRTALIFLRRRYPRQNQTLRRVALLALVSVVAVIVVEGSVNLLLLPNAPTLDATGYGRAPFVFEVGVALILCTLVMAIYESVYFFSRYRSSLLEQERLTRVNVQAQLATLRQQVNPHFLFNSLNTLVQIIPEDADKAVLFTQRLSAVYRRILEYRHRDLIPLHEELAALDDYVFLMQTRFEDKLIIKRTGDGAREPTSAGTGEQVRYIVPLTLQLLVENALKHNVVSQEQPLTIHIHLDARTLRVTNDLRPRQRRRDTTGWGQENIRQRFRLVTDREVVIAKNDLTYCVTIPLVSAKNTLSYAPA